MNRCDMPYLCEAPTVEGFVQQLAVGYVARGYWFYVTGRIPERKDPRLTDEKLLRSYRIAVSKDVRYRRKLAGIANVHYLRHRRVLVLLATHGEHEFFAVERKRIRDVRRSPISFAGYSIGYRGGRVRVAIDAQTLKDVRGRFLAFAIRRQRRWLEQRIWNLPFEPWGPVQKQVASLVDAVNGRRKRAGYELLEPACCIRRRRRQVKPFEVCRAA